MGENMNLRDLKQEIKKKVLEGYELRTNFSSNEFLVEIGNLIIIAKIICTDTEVKYEFALDTQFVSDKEISYKEIVMIKDVIDLKTKKITHQDVGQMDMYVRMYDELKKSKDDNPTIGIVLCSETDEDIAKYSILKGNEHLYASKYKLYLPSEEELRAEIESQKTIFELQQNENAG